MRENTLFRTASLGMGLRLAVLALAGLVLLAAEGCRALRYRSEAEAQRERTVKILDDGIARLDEQGADWQTVLQEVQSQLEKESQAEVTEKVIRLRQRSEQGAGTQAECILTGMRLRIVQELQRIRAGALGAAWPPAEPLVCGQTPGAVDLALPEDQRGVIDLYGFDLDAEPPVEMLVEGAQGIEDVSRLVERLTPFRMRLELDGTGVRLGPASERIVVRWSGHEIAQAAVIQPGTRVCELRQNEVWTPATIALVPALVSGDADFAGFGPQVTVAARLINDGSAVRVRISMSAAEIYQSSKQDLTRAEGVLEQDVIVAPEGWKVYELDVPMAEDVTYLDTDQAMDMFHPGGFVDIFKVIGDVEGNDVGLQTRARVKFSQIRYSLIEAGDCVAPWAVSQAQNESEFTAQTLERLLAQMHEMGIPATGE